MAQTVQFGKSKFIEEVEALQKIVDQVKQARGTASARKAAAQLEALGHKVSTSTMPAPLPADSDFDIAHIAAWVTLVNEWATQANDEVVTGILKASTTDQATLVALKEQYSDKRQLVDAMATMMNAMGIDVSDVTIPAMAKGGNSGSTGPRTVKTSGMHFYRIKTDGEKIDQSDAQDSHSSFAFYHAKKAMGLPADADRPGTAGFTEWLTSQPGFTSVTEAWEVVGADGTKYGMEILDK